MGMKKTKTLLAKTMPNNLFSPQISELDNEYLGKFVKKKTQCFTQNSTIFDKAEVSSNASQNESNSDCRSPAPA